MKVIHVTSFLSDRGGGIPPAIWGLSREMTRAGIDCVVAGLSNDPAETKAQWDGTAILSAKGHGAFGYSRELYRKVSVATIKGTLVHTHGLWMYPGVVARKTAAGTGAPLVISAHGMLDPWALRHSSLKKRVAGWAFENQNLRQAACLHALCEAEAESYQNYGLRNPICIIPNGIEIPAADISAIKSPPWGIGSAAGPKVLLYLGRIHPKKGLVNLIRAWSGLRRSEWILAIAGWDQGGHEAELKQLCVELGVFFASRPSGNGSFENAASVLFLGPQFGNNKAACYAHCDAFILPSFSEGLPMVILEAWAYGKPVIMTAECNLPEGFAADAAIRIKPNVQSITSGLASLFKSSDDSIRALGANGRVLVAARFNWHKCAQDMMTVYHWLLGNGVKPGVILN